MKVRITFEIGDEERAVIGVWAGQLGKARYATVKRFLVVKAQEGLAEARKLPVTYWSSLGSEKRDEEDGFPGSLE